MKRSYIVAKEQVKSMEKLENKNVMVVDDSEINRIIFRELLQGNLNVIEADSVDTAINIIETGNQTIDIILLDIMFRKRSGFEFLEYLGEHHYLSDIPVIVISSDSSDAFVDKAFSLGAIDYIRRPFAGRLLTRRVFTTILMYENKRELVQKINQGYHNTEQSEIDELTKLYSKKVFYDKAYQYLYNNRDLPMCMVAIDIDHFKLYNQFFGRESGDKYLAYVAESLRNFIKLYGGVAGYAGADGFYYICQDNAELFKEIQKKIRNELRARNLEIGFAPKLGIYRIEDEEKTIMDICDCADTALKHVKKEYSNLTIWYDTYMEQNNDEFKLIREVESGLRNSEFTFFIQPKCNMENGKIVGGEALVRWVKQDGKVVSPGVFIPVLEKNGFVSKVDSVVWDEVCQWQRYCIDMDYPLLPISINISRTDFYNMDVCSFLLGLMKQYDLPMNCVELEITESAYVEEYQNLSAEITKLKENGFTILMDDFGSGYSSLNSLKEIDIDVLKIDMRFLNLDGSNMSKGVSILETIVNMADSLRIPIIVEGVETEEQVNIVRTMGCAYAQGFYYYKPMKKSDFEEMLIINDSFDMAGVQLVTKESVHMLDLSEEKLLSDEIINNILGALAFYEVENGTIRLVRLNEQYYKMMGMSDVMSDPEYAIHLRKSIYEEDRDKFYELFAKADAEPVRGATDDIRYMKKDGSIQWIRVRVFSLNEHHHAKMYYATLEDITDICNSRR